METKGCLFLFSPPPPLHGWLVGGKYDEKHKNKKEKGEKGMEKGQGVTNIWGKSMI